MSNGSRAVQLVNACTSQRPDGAFCDRTSIPGAPFPICTKHAAQLYAFLRDQVQSVEGDVDRMVEAAHAVQDPRPSRWANTAGDLVVYYVQLGDLVKIGQTRNLRRRLAAYPLNRRLLATELADPSTEGRRHTEFAAHREMGREYFRPGANLIEHINRLRSRQGAQPIRGL